MRTVELPEEAIALIREGAIRPKVGNSVPTPIPAATEAVMTAERNARVLAEENGNATESLGEPSVSQRMKLKTWRETEPMPASIAAIMARRVVDSGSSTAIDWIALMHPKLPDRSGGAERRRCLADTSIVDTPAFTFALY